MKEALTLSLFSEIRCDRKKTQMANPNPSPGTRFQPGNKFGTGRPKASYTEAANRDLVLADAAEIANGLYGDIISPEELKKKTRRWFMLYRLALKDPEAFLDRYCGKPRQAIDVDATLSSGPTVEQAEHDLSELLGRIGQTDSQSVAKDAESGESKT